MASSLESLQCLLLRISLMHDALTCNFDLSGCLVRSRLVREVNLLSIMSIERRLAIKITTRMDRKLRDESIKPN
jgi:hypothetical protein